MEGLEKYDPRICLYWILTGEMLFQFVNLSVELNQTTNYLNCRTSMVIN